MTPGNDEDARVAFHDSPYSISKLIGLKCVNCYHGPTGYPSSKADFKTSMVPEILGRPLAGNSAYRLEKRDVLSSASLIMRLCLSKTKVAPSGFHFREYGKWIDEIALGGTPSGIQSRVRKTAIAELASAINETTRTRLRLTCCCS